MSNRTSFYGGRLAVKANTGDMIPVDRYPELRQALMRLSAYERTGFEPEELTKIVEHARFLAYAVEVKR